MRKVFYLTTLIILSFFGCNKEEMSYSYRIVVLNCTPTGSNISGREYERVAGAKVYFYNSKEDYLQQNAPVQEAVTDDDGEVILPLSGPDPGYWIFVEKEEFNSLRYEIEKPSSGLTDMESYTQYHSQVHLSRTPTKLQIKVLSEGQPQDAVVQLYLSEDSYYKDIAPKDEEEKMHDSYYSPRTDYFNKITDANGIVLFDNLEPRQYWFRIISKDWQKGNGKGIINISEPLENDTILNTSITVEIDESGTPLSVARSFLTNDSSKPWQLVSLIKGDQESIEPCIQDDVWIFNINSNYQVERNTLCELSYSPSEAASWEIQSGAKNFWFNGLNDHPSWYGIVSLSSTSMSLYTWENNVKWILSFETR